MSVYLIEIDDEDDQRRESLVSQLRQIEGIEQAMLETYGTIEEFRQCQEYDAMMAAG